MADSKALQRKSVAVPQTMTDMIKELMPNLPALLPPDITREQFRAAVWLELTGRSRLPESSLTSIRECTVKAATYGMLPGRDCHFLPFYDSHQKGYVAAFIPNYFGLLLQLDRTGKVSDAFAHPVYEGDDCTIDLLNKQYSHIFWYMCKPKRPQGDLMYFYACIVLKDGTRHIEPMSVEQINAVRERSPAKKSGPWVTDYIEMAKKTVLRRACKLIRGAPHLHQMIEEDETREQTSALEMRHSDNITALYGDQGTTTPTDHERVISVNRVTGEILDGDPDNPLFDLDESAALDRELATQE